MLWLSGRVALFAGLSSAGAAGASASAEHSAVRRVDQDVERRKCSPDLQGKIGSPIPIEVTGNEVAAGGTGVGGGGIVQHERLEGAIAVAFQDLDHALEPPSQTEGKVLAAIAVVVRDRLVVRDTDIGFGDDMRGAERAVAVADQDHGTAPVQRDCHHQILDAIAVEIAHIYIGPILPEVVFSGNQRLGRLLHEGAVAVTSAGDRVGHCYLPLPDPCCHRG